MSVGRFVRVSDSDPEMLRYLAAQGIALGAVAWRSRAASPSVAPSSCASASREQPLGGELARAMRIEPMEALALTLRRRAPAAALEGAADGASIALPDAAGAIPSALEQLLAKGRIRATLAMLGPAFVASVAYVDPGNFATNVQGGAQFGYLLLWVVLAANLIAMLIQYLSAKLGIVTDHSLPEVVRERFPRAVTWGMWVQAEVMAMSTDIAEFLGAALGLNLLFGVPLLPAGLITGVIAFAILELQTRGLRRFELAITALLGIIFAGLPLRDAAHRPVGARLAARACIPGLQRHAARCTSRSGSSARP